LTAVDFGEESLAIQHQTAVVVNARQLHHLLKTALSQRVLVRFRPVAGAFQPNSDHKAVANPR
jgi:hypothetical protein